MSLRSSLKGVIHCVKELVKLSFKHKLLIYVFIFLKESFSSCCAAPQTVFLIWNSFNDPLFGWLSDRSFLGSPQ